jgi:DNA repair photolyase
MGSMSLTATRRHIDTLTQVLFEPVALALRNHRTCKVVSWDGEQGLCLTVQRGEIPLLFELEQRDESRECYARTARFNINVRRAYEACRHLSPADRKLADLVIQILQGSEARLPRVERPSTSRRTAVREIIVDHMLIAEGPGQYYINPYVGCLIGCDFCYVAERSDFSRALEGLPELPWGRYLDVKVNAADVLRREVQRFPPGVVRISPILTDPYQPIERKYRITRQCLEVLLPAGFSAGVLTRAARVVEDLDLYRRHPLSGIGFSIPTDADRYRQIFEPGADPIEDRLAALETFRAAGVHTVAIVQPILPMNPERLASLLAPVVTAVRIDRMHRLDRVAHLYEEHGLIEATTDAFFLEMETRLRHAFTERNVPLHNMDYLQPVAPRRVLGC